MCFVTGCLTYPVQFCQAKANVNSKDSCNAPRYTLNSAGPKFVLQEYCAYVTSPSFFESPYILRLVSQGPELNEEQREQEAQWGPPRGDPTQWASCLRVVDPSTLESASVLELDNNEAALSMCCVRFAGGEGFMLAVGTVQNLGFYPRAADGMLPAVCKCICIILKVKETVKVTVTVTVQVVCHVGLDTSTYTGRFGLLL